MTKLAPEWVRTSDPVIRSPPLSPDVLYIKDTGDPLYRPMSTSLVTSQHHQHVIQHVVHRFRGDGATEHAQTASSHVANGSESMLQAPTQ